MSAAFPRRNWSPSFFEALGAVKAATKKAEIQKIETPVQPLPPLVSDEDHGKWQ